MFLPPPDLSLLVSLFFIIASQQLSAHKHSTVGHLRGTELPLVAPAMH